MYTGLSYIALSCVVFLLSRINNDDWESSHPCDQEPEEVESIWNILNCVWLSMGSIMGQGCDILPKWVHLDNTTHSPFSRILLLQRLEYTNHNRFLVFLRSDYAGIVHCESCRFPHQRSINKLNIWRRRFGETDQNQIWSCERRLDHQIFPRVQLFDVPANVGIDGEQRRYRSYNEQSRRRRTSQEGEWQICIYDGIDSNGVCNGEKLHASTSWWSAWQQRIWNRSAVKWVSIECVMLPCSVLWNGNV